MNYKSRLEIYTSKDIKGRAVIAGERKALRELANTLLQAAESPAGFHTVNLYKGNGHDYEILITKNITEEEWQDMPTRSESLVFVKDYDEMKASMVVEK